MNSKKEIIEFINTQCNNALNTLNTSYSNINVSKDVWWFNVATHKFDSDVNLLLKAEDKVIWVCLPKGFVNNLGSVFKIRPDKNAVDLEISSNERYMYLKDVKSGGTGFDFLPYIRNIETFN
ncbi:hypothetical protein [Arenibacter palladensis]|uniref:hypothetical protein n=1 Tax=Arenibacter palladensis TaxID=237373 RepID=UPI0026E1A937|nr:hypothetical protein [Arenibacter palladensis]MDO6604703.1 hypothetical protein [Arenibacter palladensis]